jgi:hypothetical protein
MAGLGLWNAYPATLIVECLMFIAGVWIYAKMTRARDKTGSIGFWVFVAFIALIYAGNVLGPPPPSVNAVATLALLLWLLPLWAALFDRHRATIASN